MQLNGNDTVERVHVDGDNSVAEAETNVADEHLLHQVEGL